MNRAQFLHLVLIGLVLAICVFLPRQGSAVLLVPMGPVPASAVWQRVREDVRLVGPGRVPGTMVVLPQGKVPIGHFLELGLIPVAAPAFLCGSRP